MFWGDASGAGVLWVDNYFLTDYAHWALFSWDPITKQVTRLAAAAVVAGRPVPSPQVLPVVRGGHATWVDSVDGDHSRVHLYDVAQHRDRVVYVGHASEATIAGNWLVWSGSSLPGQVATFHLIDVTSGAPLATPPPLATVSGMTSIAGDTGTLSWAGADSHRVFTWRSGMATPRLLFNAGTGDFADFLLASGRYLVWSASTSAYVADIDSGGVSVLSPDPGQPIISGTSIVLNTGGNPTKATHPISPVTVLDTRGLPTLPGCISN